MCGIAGIVAPKRADVRPLGISALTRMRHRGPDASAYLAVTDRDWVIGGDRPPPPDARALLMHRRLSILDLSPLGAQPMVTPSGTTAVAFNGEIYNYIELADPLRRAGVPFRGTSDTEVLLHLFEREGPACFSKLVGMFTGAFLDRRTERMLLVRDFFGIKPLYYVEADGVFAFASEIKALLDLPFVRRRPNADRLHDYLRFGLTDHGDETLFAGIRQLPAAHYLEVDLKSARAGTPVRFWRLKHQRIDVSFDEAVRTVRDMFLDNVRLHLRSDVPIGAALSGGIDSSAIVAGMRAVEPNLDIRSFSYIADDDALSEEKWVDTAATAARSAVTKTRPTPQELVDDLDRLIDTQDEPFGSTSIYAQYRVFRSAAENGVKVMLDGQGADELLAGYRPYTAARLATLLRSGRWGEAVRFARRCRAFPGSAGHHRLLLQAGNQLFPARLKSAARQLLREPITPPWLNREWFHRRGADPQPPRSRTDRDVLRGKLIETVERTSLPMLLRFEDRNSMAWSIESRVPFLTPAFAQYVLSLPEEYVLGPDGTSKRVFRAAMRGIVPDAILDRRDKIGFATPERRWLNLLAPWVESTLRSPAAGEVTALNRTAVTDEWNLVREGRRPFDFRVWRMVNTIRWAERFDVDFETVE